MSRWWVMTPIQPRAQSGGGDLRAEGGKLIFCISFVYTINRGANFYISFVYTKMPDLELATFDELVEEMQKRLNGGALVVIVEDKLKGEADMKVQYRGGCAAAIGLLAWAKHWTIMGKQTPIATNDDD